MSKKHVFLSQVFMTFLMATSMSGIMSLISVGPSMEWLASWPKQILIAWPIAFVITMFAWPASMGLAGKLVRPQTTTPAADAEPETVSGPI